MRGCKLVQRGSRGSKGSKGSIGSIGSIGSGGSGGSRGSEQRALGRAEVSLIDPETTNRQRLRPERGAKSPRESERGWGPASI